MAINPRALSVASPCFSGFEMVNLSPDGKKEKECTLTTVQCCSLHRSWGYDGSFSFKLYFYSFSLRTITNSPSFKDKGFIVSGAEVQWGVCIGFRAGLPSSVFLSEIFEWDQTVIRSKLAQKHTQAHIVVHMHVRRHSHIRLYLAWL